MSIPENQQYYALDAQHHTGHHVYPLHVMLSQHREWSSGF